MSRSDIKRAYSSAQVDVAGGAKKLRDKSAAERILASAGGTISSGELEEMMAIFKKEAANPHNDREVRQWLQKTTQTAERLTSSFIPQILAKVEAEAPHFEHAFQQLMDPGATSFSLAGALLNTYGGDINDLPESARTIPKAVKDILNAAVKNGATYYDGRSVEKGRLAVDHGNMMPKGKFQRYPQSRDIESIIRSSSNSGLGSAFMSLFGAGPDTQLDALDPRATMVNGEIIHKLVTEPQTFKEEIPDGNGFKLVERKMTWAEYAMTDGNPDAISFEYDEKRHPDHLAWASGDGPFSGHAMLWLDGSAHFMRAPRRSNEQDGIGMAGGILTTGSLFRGYPAFFHGHVSGKIVDVDKTPDNPEGKAMMVTQFKLSGRPSNQIADGNLKIPDPIPLLKAQGILVADGLEMTFANPGAAQNIWLNPDTAIYEKKP